MNRSPPSDRTSIRHFLDGLSPPVRRLVLALRKIIRRTVPEAEESVLWGGLSYHRPRIGGRVKGAVCQITVKRGQIRLEFIHGVRLPDRSGLLLGDALSKRHVPIMDSADVHRPGVLALIRAAGQLDPDQWTPSLASRDPG